jgi:hypothetical protein
MRTKEQLAKILRAREKKNQGLLHASLEMQTSTHFPLLIKAIQNSTGTVAELGTGLFSTPLLHWLCFDNKRKVISYESYKHYYDFAKLFTTDTHEVVFVKDWDTQKFENKYGVVFIDHTIPGRKHTRGDDAIKFKDIADFVVLHDAGSNSNEKYGYEETYKHFKYRHDWTGCQPHTTILSNFIDVTKWPKN